ncbi:MAG: hypothetical protein H6672_19795 [Anaerolineaceae bacterium]|nr:hypothetical protein [Anaerolineaceae bacterium]
MRRLGSAFTTALVMVVGLLTILGLVVGDGLGTLSVLVEASGLRQIADLFLQVVVITTATTILIGILNLFAVHLGRIGRRAGGWFYSLILVLSALAVIVITVLERANVLTGQPSLSAILLETVQVSIESALAGLVLFALVYGAFRLMRRRVTWWAMLFTLVLIVLLLGALPLPAVNGLASIRNWLLAVPVSAGARGILLGIALATVVTGVRILIGQDRSYRE